jgi:hypothetical protein
MKKILLLSVIVTFSFFISCGEKTKDNADETVAETSTKSTKIEVIQFHSENRCMTCNKIEALTLETLKTFPELEFKLINVDDAKNEKIAESFEASGTALFLYNPSTKDKLDLTDFAFMTAGDETKFAAELKKEIEKFVN